MAVSATDLEDRLKREQNARDSRDQAVNAASTTLTEELVKDTVLQETRRIAQEALEAAKKRQKALAQLQEDIFRDLVATAATRQAAREALAEARELSVPALKKKYLLSRALRIWKGTLARKLEKRRQQKEHFYASARDFAVSGFRPTSSKERATPLLSVRGDPLDMTDEAALEADLKALEAELESEAASLQRDHNHHAEFRVLDLDWSQVDLCRIVRERPHFRSVRAPLATSAQLVASAQRKWTLAVAPFEANTGYPTDVLFQNWFFKKLGYPKDSVKTQGTGTGYYLEICTPPQWQKTSGSPTAELCVIQRVDTRPAARATPIPAPEGLVFLLRPHQSRYHMANYWEEEKARFDWLLSLLSPPSSPNVSFPVLVLYLDTPGSGGLHLDLKVRLEISEEERKEKKRKGKKKKKLFNASDFDDACSASAPDQRL